MAGASGKPAVDALETLLVQLYGKPVTVKLIPKGAVEPPWVVSLYRLTSGTVQVVCISELAIACHAGAALSLMPISAVEESVAAGSLSEALMENYHEVMNVTATFLSNHWSRVNLGEIVNPPAAASPVILRKALTAKLRFDVEVGIPGYGNGRVLFASL